MKFLDEIKDEDIIKDSNPRDDDERELLKMLIKNFGEFTSIAEVSKKFKISKSYLYVAREEKKFVSYKMGKRIIIMTKTLINFMRHDEEE